jgi:hypothetical protein
MEWRENSTDLFVSISSSPLYHRKLTRLELKINNRIIEILVCGSFSIKKRKVVLHGIIKNSYKVTVHEIPSTLTYLGVTDDPFAVKIYPLVKTNGLLFNSTSKKFLINKRQSKIDILLDNNGKMLN